MRCELDEAKYPKGIVVSEQQMKAISITRSEFHGEWNYTIHPGMNPDYCLFNYRLFAS